MLFFFIFFPIASNLSSTQTHIIYADYIHVCRAFLSLNHVFSLTPVVRHGNSKPGHPHSLACASRYYFACASLLS